MTLPTEDRFQDFRDPFLDFWVLKPNRLIFVANFLRFPFVVGGGLIFGLNEILDFNYSFLDSGHFTFSVHSVCVSI